MVKRGSVLITALLLVAVITVLALALLAKNTLQYTGAERQAASVRAYQMALAGLEDESAIDMKRAYFDNARAFFLLLAGVLAISLLKDIVINGHLPGPANVAFHVVYALGALIAAATRKPWVHEVYAPFAALAFTAYIIILFDRIA